MGIIRLVTSVNSVKVRGLLDAKGFVLGVKFFSETVGFLLVVDISVCFSFGLCKFSGSNTFLGFPNTWRLVGKWCLMGLDCVLIGWFGNCGLFEKLLFGENLFTLGVKF